MEYKALPFSSVWENGIFNLPIKVVDEYLKLASEYQLKALLYIFRNNGRLKLPKLPKHSARQLPIQTICLNFGLRKA